VSINRIQEFLKEPDPTALRKFLLTEPEIDVQMKLCQLVDIMVQASGVSPRRIDEVWGGYIARQMSISVGLVRLLHCRFEYDPVALAEHGISMCASYIVNCEKEERRI
jgi:hypothetical protein